MFRQGDVLIQRSETLPEGASKVAPDEMGRLILAEGEVTGHAHAVLVAAATMYMYEAMLYLDVHRKTELLHEEHSKIDLDPGLYKITRQREYFPEAIRNVAD